MSVEGNWNQQKLVLTSHTNLNKKKHKLQSLYLLFSLKFCSCSKAEHSQALVRSVGLCEQVFVSVSHTVCLITMRHVSGASAYVLCSEGEL